MLLIFPLQTSFYVSCLSFDKFKLLILGILNKFMKLVHLPLLVQFYFPFFLKAFSEVYKVFLSNFLDFFSFHLVYLLKALMKLYGPNLDDPKSFDEMEQRNSEKSQKVLVLLMTNNSFACLLLISEQISLLDIALIWLDVFCYI